MSDDPPRSQVRQSSPDSDGALDPRVARTRRSVLRTATDLLVEGGPGAVTIDAIVTRSGVARSTIYRHWESRDDVLVEVISSCAPHIEPPEPDLDFEQALRLLVGQLCEVLADPEWARVVPALLALRNQDHGIAELEQRIEQRQEHALESVLRRGVEEGRLDPGVDVDRATALLVGPLLFASVMEKPAVDDALGELVVDAFLRVTDTGER